MVRYISYTKIREGDIMNVSLKLALDDLKRNKHDTIALIILAIIVFTLLLSTAICLPLYYQSSYQSQIEKQGKWIYYSQNIDRSTYEYLKQNNSLVCGLKITGSYEDQYYVSMVEDNISQLVNTTKMIRGHFPQAGEIALSQSIINSLPDDYHVGDIITIKYITNDQEVKVVTARLSGIIVEQTINDLSALGDIVLPLEKSEDGLNCFVYDKQLAGLRNSDDFYPTYLKKSNNQDIAAIYNQAYQLDNTSRFANRTSFVMICMIVMIVARGIMYGTVFTTMEKRRYTYTLLRAIGQTKQQAHQMSFYQTILVALIGLLFSLVMTVLVVIIALMIIKAAIYQKALIDLDLLLIILALVSGIIIIYEGVVLPNIQASKQALTGKFENKKFKVFESSKHKLKSLKLRRLAWRELTKNPLFICIVILIFNLAFFKVDDLMIVSSSYHQKKPLYNRIIKDNGIRISSDCNSGLDDTTLEQLKQYSNEIYYSKRVLGNEEGFYWSNLEQSLFGQNNYHYDDRQIITDNIYYYSFDDDLNSQDYLKQYLQGRMPADENEVVVYAPFLATVDVFKRLDAIDYLDHRMIDFNASSDQTWQLGSKLTVYQNNRYEKVDDETTIDFQALKEYEIVGIIDYLPDDYLIYDDEYFGKFSLIVNNDEFNHKASSLNKISSGYNNVLIKTKNQPLLLAKINQLNNITQKEVVSISHQYSDYLQNLAGDYHRLILIVLSLFCLSVLLFGYIAVYRSFTIKNQIGNLKAIGMTNRQIVSWYRDQIIILGSLGLIYPLFMIIERIYLRYLNINNLIMVLVIYAIYTIVLALVYCLPLRKILKMDIIELFDKKD